jgi:diguanylate cyclase (GGDEF)-like protein
MSMTERSISTLASDEISRFLMRTRREEAERYEVRLDEHLREVLARADDFVPSEAGAILLDDPRAKMIGSTHSARLTVIACFGSAGHGLGVRIPIDQGTLGEIYRAGTPHVSDEMIGVPVVLGESICGVLELRGRRSEIGGYTTRDLELLRIFAAYISSSIQNVLDAMRARELARRDDLTGLYNDRFLYQRLAEEIGRAERDGTGVALLFLDLDDFKHVNDTYGHIAGSRTLREVGQLIGGMMPPGAISARYGGDEFVIILPGADKMTALQVAEQLRSSIEKQPLLAGAADLAISPAGLHVTCSVGVASYNDHVGPFGPTARRQNALLRLADTAMYLAKSCGKNRVEVAAVED